MPAKTPEQFGVMSQELLTIDEEIYQGAASTDSGGATPTFVTSYDNTSQDNSQSAEYFIRETYVTANTPGWVA